MVNAMEEKDMLYVENLTKYFKDLCAVDRINFDIQRGEIVGLLGPNGAGKSTTLRMITGFLRPSSGTVRVRDYAIDTHPLEIKKLLGYLPESAPFYHDMLVYDYLGYVASIRGLDEEQTGSQISRLVDLCGLAEVMHKPISEISKGYKQRVGLAHAMMNDPEILVLDEPTIGLDPNQVVEIRDIIKRIGKEKTIIFSTHILSEAEATCDRIIIIHHGKIIADDRTETVRKSASEERLIDISLGNADLKSVEKKLASLDGIVDCVPVDQADNILHVRLTCKSPADIRGDIYHMIKDTDWILLEFHQETKTLEKVFQELTTET
jgi:ABC-2 type transport system ATP-binding protein